MHYFDSFTRPGLEPRTVRSEIKIVAPLQWNIEMTIRGAQEQAGLDNGSSSHHFVLKNICFDAVTLIASATEHPWIIMVFCSSGFDQSSARKISETLFFLGLHYPFQRLELFTQHHFQLKMFNFLCVLVIRLHDNSSLGARKRKVFRVQGFETSICVNNENANL